MKVIYITQGIPGAAQDGSYSKPYQVHADKPDEFDAIFRANRGPNTFLLYPGYYRTRGCWAYGATDWAIIDPNASIVGLCGSALTNIVLDQQYTEVVNGQPAEYLETLITGGEHQTGSEKAVIGGITIDCTFARLPVIGLHTWSSGAKILDVRVIGLRGALGHAGPGGGPNGMEGFGILVNDGLGSRGGGSTISDCSVQVVPVADQYLTAFYLGSTAVKKSPNLIQNCYAYATVFPGQNFAHAAFAANENTTVQNCVGNGFERFLFCDTGNVGDIEVTNCRGEYGSAAIDLPAPNGKGITYRRRIRITDSTFTNPVASAPYAAFLLIQDGPGNEVGTTHNTVDIHDIDVNNVRLSSVFNTGGAAVSQGFFTVSIGGTKVQRVWVRNSTIPVGAKTATPGPAPAEEGGTLPNWGTPQTSFSFEDLKYMSTAVA